MQSLHPLVTLAMLDCDPAWQGGGNLVLEVQVTNQLTGCNGPSGRGGLMQSQCVYAQEQSF